MKKESADFSTNFKKLNTQEPPGVAAFLTGLLKPQEFMTKITSQKGFQGVGSQSQMFHRRRSGAYDQGHCRLRFSLGSSCQRCPIKVLEKGCTLQDMKCALPILQARIQQGRGIQDISWYFCLSSESFKRIGALESRQGSKGFELTPQSAEVLLLLLPKPNIGTNTSAGLNRIEMPWG